MFQSSLLGLYAVDFLLIATALLGVYFVAKRLRNQWLLMTDEEREASTERILRNLVPIAIGFVTDAEKEFGAGTGAIKKSVVIGKLYALIPDEYKRFVTEDNLAAIVRVALTDAQILWTDPAMRKLIAQDKNEVPFKFEHGLTKMSKTIE